MLLYAYRALGSGGMIYKGHLHTHSRQALRTCLDEKGLALISGSCSFATAEAILSSLLFSPRPQDFKEFYQQLVHFEMAGIPLRESLEALMQVENNKVLKKTLTNLSQHIDNGMLFSAALEQYPSLFENFVVRLIESGEKTGQLSQIFMHLVTYFEWKTDLRVQVLRALRYPLLISILLLLALYFLLTTLVPELVNFMTKAKENLPFSTYLLIKFAQALSHYGSSLLKVGFLGTLLVGAFLKLHPKGSHIKSCVLDKIPVLGKIQKKLLLADFFCLLSVLIQGKIDILKALEIAEKTLTFSSLRREIQNIKTSVHQGLALSDAFENVGIFPSLSLRLIRIGEQTNTLPQNVERIRIYLDKTTKQQIDRFVSLLEPALLLIVGASLGWIVSAVFSPLYESFSLFEV